MPGDEGQLPEDVAYLGADDVGSAPRHGYQGDRGAALKPPRVPASPTLALSRESGSRGGTIGRRVAARLGWAVYDQELLEYMAQDGVVRQGVLDNLSAESAAWIEARLQQLLRQEQFRSGERVPSEKMRGVVSPPVPSPTFLNLARLVLALGTQGEVVLIGRGSGYILPSDSTLHARIVAPLPERIAYMSNWLRLSREEAEERVRQRDQRRTEFIQTHFQIQPDDVHLYDLVLNSSLLGEALCVELLVQAAHTVSEAGLPKGRIAAPNGG